jgi:hypothetical protein
MHETVYSLRGFHVETVQYFMALYTYDPCIKMPWQNSPGSRVHLGASAKPL